MMKYGNQPIHPETGGLKINTLYEVSITLYERTLYTEGKRTKIELETTLVLTDESLDTASRVQDSLIQVGREFEKLIYYTRSDSNKQ